MNNTRRKKIKAIIALLNNNLSSLEEIKEEEDEAREEIPENLQNGEMYEYSENCSDHLEEATSSIQESINELEEIL